jgi:hypothetical protein
MSINTVDDAVTNGTDVQSVVMTTVANGSQHVDAGSSFQVEENKSVRVECSAAGTGGVPDVRITLGLRTDITSLFNRVQSERKIGPHGLERVIYEVRLVRDRLLLTADDDGKRVKCSARVHDYPELTTRVSTTLDVRCMWAMCCFVRFSSCLTARYCYN